MSLRIMYINSIYIYTIYIYNIYIYNIYVYTIYIYIQYIYTTYIYSFILGIFFFYVYNYIYTGNAVGLASPGEEPHQVASEPHEETLARCRLPVIHRLSMEHGA